ncbi:1519_t:CDS:2 [Gigaspora margarita]|uniref:1519_t:CDS:1 n=1 Tax=Gigaspora margarita TaxID=4874 RepID=A0ABN7VE44_GIGMA|nr:1519_t:CDS:2 [Gigaspora margarita]
MVINENPTPSRLIICDAAAKEWKDIKKIKESKIDDIIKKYLATLLKFPRYFQPTASSQPKLSEISKMDLSQNTTLQILQTFDDEIRNYASAQKQAASSKVAAEKKINELGAVYNFTTDLQLRHDLHHLDGHYCLASVKGVRQFAHAFPNVSVIISQDDKAKIGLGIPAVGRTFCTLQSVSELVQLPDHDFACGSGQKLILSVYLIINPNEENNDLRTGQSIGTSSITHMEDLISLVSDNQYSEALKTNNEIKPIWILLVNGGQSKYNPVERSMATLSGKLAGIVLPINHFGKHLDSQGNIIDTNLAAQNFNYAGTMLCDIWCRDPIFGKHAKDGHYINPIHLLQYSEQLKVPGYDEHCPSIKGQKKNQPSDLESVVEAVVITNAMTLEDFNVLPSQQSKNYDFLVNNVREYASNIEI